MNFAEMKQAAWQRVMKEGWFGRLFWGSFLLGLCSYFVQSLIAGGLETLNVPDWMSYAEAVMRNSLDQVTPIPNLTDEYVNNATSATALLLFFNWLMTAISTYGAAVLIVRCVRNESGSWLRAAFGGFRYPFGLLWLMVRYTLIMFGWSLLVLAFFPLGLPLWIVAFYRYRFLWLVKAEHPDWSAGQCLKATRERMKGHKMASFKLDCAYWKPITLVLLMMMAALALAYVSTVACAVLMLLAAGAALVTSFYLRVGQAFLYRQIHAE